LALGLAGVILNRANLNQGYEADQMLTSCQAATTSKRCQVPSSSYHGGRWVPAAFDHQIPLILETMVFVIYHMFRNCLLSGSLTLNMVSSTYMIILREVSLGLGAGTGGISVEMCGRGPRRGCRRVFNIH
jgi:hypothetical protein